ncbi:MAG: peptidase MA family metallohydrolase [Pseudomonadota bacterium]|nr:peptidase MA family metallohydrolase [Pseudomonadota bacterium]
MLAYLLWLYFLVGTALGGPTWRSAPTPMVERPAVAEPAGGWWSEDGQYARVHGGGGDIVTTRRLADHAAAAVPRIAHRLGVPAGGAIDIYLAPTQADFERIQPDTPPDWADGTAWPRWGMIFLRAPSARPGTAERLEQVLDHELVHVLVGRAFAPRTPPRWLQEGLAQYYSGELGPKVSADLTSVLFGRDELFSLTQLSSGFHGGAAQAHHAYAAAADFVGYLGTTYGEDSVGALITEMAAGASFSDALATATGSDLATVEAGWRGRWNDPALLASALATTDLLWAGGGILLILGAWRARRRTRKKLEGWEREEEWLRGMQERMKEQCEPGPCSTFVN